MTVVAIHQPNYLPWLGFFHKMSQCDVFVLLDTVQFTKGGYQNRAKIKGPNGEILLTVPVLTKGRFAQTTMEVEINNGEAWRRKHWKAITQSYSKAPYFDSYRDALREVYQRDWALLALVCEEFIWHIAQALGLQTPIVRASDLGVTGTASELLAAICASLAADVYLSGPSGRKYLDERHFERRGIEVQYHVFDHPVYPQRYGAFLAGMSALDFLFNCGPSSLEVLRKCVPERE